MKKMTREELIDFMVEDELDMMSMEDLAYNFEYAMKHGTRGYSEYSNEELDRVELIRLMSDTRIFNNDVGEYAIDILLKKNSRVRRTSRGKYQFIIED